MSANPLENRIAVITGASAGIGQAAAHKLAAAGARLVVNARRADRLDDLAKELGPDRVAVVAGDAAEEATIQAMLDAAVDRFGAQADLVVVNAGRGLRGSVMDSDSDEWEEMIRINILGASRLMRAAAARMAGLVDAEDFMKRPRDIVVLGSNVGKHISPFSSMYGSTKFAVNSLAEALRRELAPTGVRVTLIAPGIVKSEFQDAAGYDALSFGEFMERVGPVLEPEDVAGLILYVVSQRANVHVNDVVIRPTRQEYP